MSKNTLNQEVFTKKGTLRKKSPSFYKCRKCHNTTDTITTRQLLPFPIKVRECQNCGSMRIGKNKAFTLWEEEKHKHASRHA